MKELTQERVRELFDYDDGRLIRRWKRRRLNAAKVSLAGYEAKLKQTKDLLCRPNVSTIPGAVVADMQEFSQQIAKLQERIRQLESGAA